MAEEASQEGITQQDTHPDIRPRDPICFPPFSHKLHKPLGGPSWDVNVI